MTVRGMNMTTGRAITGLDHLKQSIRDILVTPLGSRVMVRDYGSRLFELVDAPINQGTLVQLYAATAEALDKWEPRFRLLRVSSEATDSGRVSLTVEGEYVPEGQMITLAGIIL